MSVRACLGEQNHRWISTGEAHEMEQTSVCVFPVRTDRATAVVLLRLRKDSVPVRPAETDFHHALIEAVKAAFALLGDHLRFVRGRNGEKIRRLTNFAVCKPAAEGAKIRRMDSLRPDAVPAWVV